MNWTEIKIKVPAKEIDKATDIANVVTEQGIYIEDYSNLEAEALEIAHIDLIDEGLLKKDRDFGIIHVYINQEDNPIESIAFLKERLSSCKIPNEILTSQCNQEDWINNWKKYFKPINVGKKLLIQPLWENESHNNIDRVVLKIEPGLAFGTGSHETTRLCLEFLEKFLKKDDSVLDIGCGSGILSISSLLMGAKHATGVDIDSLAVKTAVENAKINNVQNKFHAICGNLTQKVSGTYDVIVANIVADVIISLSQNVCKFMSENTTYIMSGIIDSRKKDVLNSLSTKFDIIEEKTQNGWVALVAKMK